MERKPAGGARRRYARVLVAGLGVVLAAASIVPAEATDLESLRVRAQEIADRVTSLEHQRAALAQRRARLETAIAAVSHEIGLLELELNELEAVFNRARDAYVDRAVELYKSGPGGNLEILLSARNLSELVALSKISNAATEAADESLRELIQAQTQAAATQQRVDSKKQRLIAAQSRVAAVTSEIEATLTSRHATLRELNQEIKKLEAEARAAGLAGGPYPYGARPDDEFLKLLAPAGPSQGIPKEFVGTGVSFEGIASWYGPGFEGNHTASGDIFDSSLYTAASKELPLGTWLYVEHEGRGVVVLINDRGPYVDDRILDLSRAAAFSIGITGLGWVKAEILLKK